MPHAHITPNANRDEVLIIGRLADATYELYRLHRLTIDEADWEMSAHTPLAATLQLLSAPHPSSDTDGDLSSFAHGPVLSDAALTAALITEQLGDADVLPTTGVRSSAAVPVRPPVSASH